MKRILLLGINGMLGSTCFNYLTDQSEFDVYGTVRNENYIKFFNEKKRHRIVRLSNLKNAELNKLFYQVKPDYVVNCIGIIKQAHLNKNHVSSIEINSLFPHRLLEFCEQYKAILIHVSTDCVFSGKKGMYKEKDHCDAKDLYGRSKKLGEIDYSKNAITLRTSIIGHELKSHLSLLDWFLNEQNTVSGFTKAFFSGVTTLELAKIIHNHILPNNTLHGLFHVSADKISKYELLNIISRIYKHDIIINKCSDFEIDRSLDSSLFRGLTGYVPPAWGDMIQILCNFTVENQ